MDIPTKTSKSNMALEREHKYFMDNHDEISSKYLGKVVLIVGEEIITCYDTIIEAYWGAQSLGYELGSFMITTVKANRDDYTVYLYSVRHAGTEQQSSPHLSLY